MLIKDLLDRVKVIVIFFIGVELLWRIFCLGIDEVWLSGKGKIIICVDIDGIVWESVISIC